MRRGLYIVLALSLGLNGGLLYEKLSHRETAPPRERPEMGDDPEKHIEFHLKLLVERVGVSESQRDAIRSVLAGRLPPIVEQLKQFRERRRAMADLYGSPELDSARFQEEMEQVAADQRKLDELVTEAMLAEGRILTPEQRRKYAEVMPWMGRGRHGHGPGAESPSR